MKLGIVLLLSVTVVGCAHAPQRACPLDAFDVEKFSQVLHRDWTTLTPEDVQEIWPGVRLTGESGDACSGTVTLSNVRSKGDSCADTFVFDRYVGSIGDCSARLTAATLTRIVAAHTSAADVASAIMPATTSFDKSDPVFTADGFTQVLWPLPSATYTIRVAIDQRPNGSHMRLLAYRVNVEPR